MNDPMDLILRPEVSPTNAFPASSRYYGFATTTLDTPQGTTIVYLRRRFLPDVSGLTVRQEHRVAKGDRLDNVTALYLGDPQLFWRIADANNAMRAETLTERPGRLPRIALAEGPIGSLP
jgi:hypothetical protein